MRQTIERIKCMDRVSSEEVLTRVNENKTLADTIMFLFILQRNKYRVETVEFMAWISLRTANNHRRA